MNEEELKQKAEDFVIDRYKIAECYREDNAETREYMRMDVHSQYEEEYQLYLDATKELEKENAELKAYNEKLLDGDIEKHNKIVELQAEVISLKNKCRQYENGYAYEKLYELRVQVENKLDEAKEIIKRLLKATYGEGWNYSLQVKVEAEKFLKESE